MRSLMTLLGWHYLFCHRGSDRSTAFKGELLAACDTKFPQDSPHVGLNRALPNFQFLSNLPVGESPAHIMIDLPLSGGQVGRVPAREFRGRQATHSTTYCRHRGDQAL